MLTIFVLFVGLTLATAVIAYWSDNLGKKLGKKRVSLWGMRPRTTATFLTIASSWVIMIFTLGAMLVAFPPLRRALLRYDEVRKSAGDLKLQVGALDGQLVELRGQKQTLTNQFDEASTKLADVGAKLQQARGAVARAQIARGKAQTEATQARQSASAATARQNAALQNERAARGNLEKVRGQLDSTQQQRAAAVQQLKVAQTDLKEADAEVLGARARVRAAENRVKIASVKAQQAEAQLELVQTNLVKAQQNEINARISADNAGKAAIEAGKSAIAAEIKAVQAEAKVAPAEAKVAQLTAQREQLQKDNDELNRVNARLSDDNIKIRDTALILSQSDVRVPVDSTLVERSFAQSVTTADARNDLRAMFERGATKIVPGLLPNAKLVLSEIASPDGKRLLSDDEIYDNLVNFIVNNPNALSVRLVAARNHLAGESVLEARFLAVPIRPALPDKFELASIEVDGKIGEGPLFSALLELVDDGTAIAKSKGVRPPLSPDIPNFYAPGSREQIFDALRKIKALNAPARVSILTTQAISTTDQLRVRFEVEPIGAVSGATTTTVTARIAPPKS